MHGDCATTHMSAGSADTTSAEALASGTAVAPIPEISSSLGVDGGAEVPSSSALTAAPEFSITTPAPSRRLRRMGGSCSSPGEPGADPAHINHPFVKMTIPRATVNCRHFYDAMHEIVPRVILGDFSAAADPDEISAGRITHVVNTLGTSAEKARHVGIRYTTFAVDDVPSAKVAPYFLPVARWIAAVLAAHPEHRVLIHCAAGVSRSSSMTIAYLMHAQRLRVAEAFLAVQSKRTIIMPNPGFRSQLVSWDCHLFDGAPWPHPDPADPSRITQDDPSVISPIVTGEAATWPVASPPAPKRFITTAGGVLEARAAPEASAGGAESEEPSNRGGEIEKPELSVLDWIDDAGPSVISAAEIRPAISTVVTERFGSDECAAGAEVASPVSGPASEPLAAAIETATS